MMLMPNIFLMGEAGAGKDTVAEYLRTKYRFEQFALGDAVRSEYFRWFGTRATRLDRAQLIEVAETYKALYGADVWCRTVHETVESFSALHAHPPILISDGRFNVEYGYFTMRGYIPVRVKVADEVRFERLKQRDGWDQRKVLAGKEQELRTAFAQYELDNNGTVRELECRIDTMMLTLGLLRPGGAR